MCVFHIAWHGLCTCAHIGKCVCVCVCVCVCLCMHETFLSVTGNLLTVVTFDEYSWESMEPWPFFSEFHAYLCCFNT